MAYSELIKNFGNIRDYMREFYVYGFKSRNDFKNKSARSYDNERRRIESWLGDYMGFRQTAEGKQIFLSIDSRESRHNPLYAAWKTKSFTDVDITLHFLIFDILSDPEISFTVDEIVDEIYNLFDEFSNPKTVDASTVRKKLKEYVKEGMIVEEKRGKASYFRRADSIDFKTYESDWISFFSEVSPCGVIGSFLLDKMEKHEDYFSFKHHYITNTLDSEILCQIFQAMSEQSVIEIETINHRNGNVFEQLVVPLKIFISVQNGRQYLMAASLKNGKFNPYRIENIISIKMSERCENFTELRKKLDDARKNMWGIKPYNQSEYPLEHVEFTVKYSDEETFIHQRLEREKRCGKVERLDKNTSKFSADVVDIQEMIPWIRTFICRITDLHFSNKALEKQFWEDIDQMYKMYDLEGGAEK